MLLLKLFNLMCYQKLMAIGISSVISYIGEFKRKFKLVSGIWKYLYQSKLNLICIYIYVFLPSDILKTFTAI